MADKSTQHSFDVWTIRSARGGAAAAIVPELGGMVSSLLLPCAGVAREVLFLHEWCWDRAATRTRGGIPFLFPICGRLERDGAADTYLYDGARYQLPIHGFSLRMPWRVVAHDAPDELVISLSDTAQTRAAYPFKFSVTLRYRITHDRLSCEQTYANHSAVPMPFYAGFHPYFLTPRQAKAGVRVAFEAERGLAYNQRLTDVVGARPAPPSPISVTSARINERLVCAKDGAPAALLFSDGFRLDVSARGIGAPRLFPYLQFYTMPEKPFFCIEPWMGFPNAMNTVQGARWLAPGRSLRGMFVCAGSSAAPRGLRESQRHAAAQQAP